MSTVPRISIIIVSWNGRDLVERCLASLQTLVHTSHEVIVVDNHSSDGTAEMIEKKFPQVQLIKNTSNRGFSAANNQGAAVARGEFFFFLNADTEVVDDPLPLLGGELERNETTGLIAPRLLNSDGTIQNSIRHFPGWSDQVVTLLKLRHLLYRTSIMRRYRDTRAQKATVPVDVDEVMGAAMLMRRKTFTTLGGWDEQYWIWFEDVDLCQRVHRLGQRVVYVPAVSIIHHGGASFGQVVSLKKQLWFMRSLWTYARRFWSPVAAYSLWMFFPLSYALTLVQTLLKPR